MIRASVLEEQGNSFNISDSLISISIGRNDAEDSNVDLNVAQTVA